MSPTGLKWAVDPVADVVTTAGDLLYGTAADTVARLGIGTAGQVLAVDSGATAPEWVTPAASTPTFVGVGVKKSANQNTSNATFTAVTFNLEDFDTDTFHDNSSNNTRITIPAGKSGYYAIAGAVQFNANGTGNRGCELLKNGSAVNYMFFEPAAGAGNEAVYPMSFILNLAATDYLEISVYQTSGGTLSVQSASTKWQVQYLGA